MPPPDPLRVEDRRATMPDLWRCACIGHLESITRPCLEVIL